jgi:hypothetical protein
MTDQSANDLLKLAQEVQDYDFDKMNHLFQVCQEMIFMWDARQQIGQNMFLRVYLEEIGEIVRPQ